MRFISSSFIKSELNKISFLIKLSYYEKILPKSTPTTTGKIRQMIDNAKVDWEDITWVNIKTKPRALGKEDIIGDFEEGLLAKKGPSIYDDPDDPKKRISFELHGKLKDSQLPIKLKVLRGNKSDESTTYSIFMKNSQGEFTLMDFSKNTAGALSILDNLYEKFKDRKDNIEIDKKVDTLETFYYTLIPNNSSSSNIKNLLIEEYSKKEKPPYKFDLKPNFYKNKKYIDFDFKPLVEENQNRLKSYEEDILNLFKDYINKTITDKEKSIDLNNLNFSLSTEGKVFKLKVK
jgi:hypothetical protein